MIGVESTSCLHASGPGSSRLLCGPSVVAIDVTISSRMASSGGLVTWANICLKYSNSIRGFSLRTAIGVSVPIDPIGSAPVRASGPSRIFRSSLVHPKVRWWVTTEECCGVSMNRGGRSSR